METPQKSKAQGWVSGHNAVEGPQGYFLGSLSVSPGHPSNRWCPLAMDVIGRTGPMRVAAKSAHSRGDRG